MRGASLFCITLIGKGDKIIAELIQAHRERNTSKPYEIRGFEVFLHCIGETCIQVMDKDGDFGGFLLRICQSTVCRVCKMGIKAGIKPVSSEFLTRGDGANEGYTESFG